VSLRTIGTAVRFRIAAIAFRPIALPTVDSRMLDMNRPLARGAAASTTFFLCYAENPAAKSVTPEFVNLSTSSCVSSDRSLGPTGVSWSVGIA
jgi:hypothetical protein